MDRKIQVAIGDALCYLGGIGWLAADTAHDGPCDIDRTGGAQQEHHQASAEHDQEGCVVLPGDPGAVHRHQQIAALYGIVCYDVNAGCHELWFSLAQQDHLALFGGRVGFQLLDDGVRVYGFIAFGELPGFYGHATLGILDHDGCTAHIRIASK